MLPKATLKILTSKALSVTILAKGSATVAKIMIAIQRANANVIAILAVQTTENVIMSTTNANVLAMKKKLNAMKAAIARVAPITKLLNVNVAKLAENALLNASMITIIN